MYNEKRQQKLKKGVLVDQGRGSIELQAIMLEERVEVS